MNEDLMKGFKQQFMNTFHYHKRTDLEEYFEGKELETKGNDTFRKAISDIEAIAQRIEKEGFLGQKIKETKQ